MEKIRNEYFTLQWHLTERCNLRCMHCYQDERYLKKEIDIDKKKRVISDFAAFCKKLGKKPRIAFTGGEPLIIREELFELIEFCNNRYPKIKKTILSNGTIMTDEDIRRFKGFNMDEIQISLDGAKKETHDYIRGTGNYDKTIDTINRLVDAGIDTRVMSVFHKKNYKEMPELIELCRKLKVKSLGITELVPEGRGKDIYDLMLSPEETRSLFIEIAEKQIEIIENGQRLRIDMNKPLWILLKDLFPKHKDLFGAGCSLGISDLALMPNNDVLPCRRIDIVIGNLDKDTFFDIWYGSELLWKFRDRDKIGECAGCDENRFCGGCKAVSYAVTGDLFRKDPMCWKEL